MSNISKGYEIFLTRSDTQWVMQQYTY